MKFIRVWTDDGLHVKCICLILYRLSCLRNEFLNTNTAHGCRPGLCALGLSLRLLQAQTPNLGTLLEPYRFPCRFLYGIGVFRPGQLQGQFLYSGASLERHPFSYKRPCFSAWSTGGPLRQRNLKEMNYFRRAHLNQLLGHPDY